MESYQENIYVLAYHSVTNSSTQFWRAVAVFTHKPLMYDILNLYNFSKDQSFDRAIAEILAEKQYCALFFGPRGKEFELSTDKFNCQFNSGFKYIVSEYMIIHPRSNGDLNLSDYLISGYCDDPDRIAKEGKGVWFEDTRE